MPSRAAPARISDEAPEITGTFVNTMLTTTANIQSPILIATLLPVISAQPSLLTSPEITHTEGACFTLSVPSEGAVYPNDIGINFIWESMPGAVKYILEVTTTAGWLLSIETSVTDYEITPNMFPGETQYSWTVSAVDSSGNKICKAGPGNFSITAIKSQSTQKPENDDGGGIDGPDDDVDEDDDWDL